MRSSHNLVVSPDADDDIRSILEYTIANWDTEQQDIYANHIAKVPEDIALFPEMGRVRPEIAAELRSFPVGRHVIYYRVLDQTVVIPRVVHGRMDISSMFGE